jgi:hypothetical protein
MGGEGKGKKKEEKIRGMNLIKGSKKFQITRTTLKALGEQECSCFFPGVNCPDKCGRQ